MTDEELIIPYQISQKFINFGTILSDTINSTVHLGVSKQDDTEKQIAIKYNKAVPLTDKNILDLAKLKHKHVIPFLGTCFGKNGDLNTRCLVFEFAEKKSLADHLHSKDSINAREILKWVTDAANGVCYLHFELSPPIVHRDLKSSNILISGNGMGKLADFGMDKSCPTATYLGPHGTPNWAAPEVVRGKIVTFKSDVWSFGIIIWELTTRCIPHDDLKGDHFKMVQRIAENAHPAYPSSCPIFMEKIMNQCLKPSSSDRIRIDEVLIKLENLQCSNKIKTTTGTLQTFWSDRPSWIESIRSQGKCDYPESNLEFILSNINTAEASQEKAWEELLEMCGNTLAPYLEPILSLMLHGSETPLEIPPRKLSRIKTTADAITQLKHLDEIDVCRIDWLLEFCIKLNKSNKDHEILEPLRKRLINYQDIYVFNRPATFPEFVDSRDQPRLSSTRMVSEQRRQLTRAYIQPLGPEINYISKHLGRDWRNLARGLKFSLKEIDNFENNYSDLESRARNCLNKWVEDQGHSIDRSHLVKALDESNLKLLAYRVENHKISM